MVHPILYFFLNFLINLKPELELSANRVCVDLVISPLQIARSRSGKPRVVVDLSFPPGSSVSNGIASDSYLDKPFVLRLPGIDALTGIIRCKGRGCHLFKKDLRGNVH